MNDKAIESNRLTGKQQAFVAAYLSNGFNGTKAAVEAGYAVDSAHVEGSRLLRNAKVVAVIEQAFKDKGISAGAVEILLSIIALDSDVTDFEPWIKGEKTLEQLRADGVDTRVVKSATVSGNTRKLELHDRLAAAREIVRVLGLVTEKQEVGVRQLPALDDTPAEVEAAVADVQARWQKALAQRTNDHTR